MEWKPFPRYWPFVRGIHRPPVNSPHKGQWRGAAMFSLICAWINILVNSREAADLRRHRAQYDVNVMSWVTLLTYEINVKTIPINSLRRNRNRRHFADDIFKCTFLNENEWILLRISLKFVRTVRISNIPALAQIITRRLPDKPLSE